MNLKELYEETKGIVHKCRKDYHLHLWEKEDWDQEGMMCLYELVSSHPQLLGGERHRLYVCFKTKFRNRILDNIRKQESHKRRFNKEPYEEVSEISHRLGEKGLRLDDYYLFHELLKNYKSKQSMEKQELIDRLMGGEVFRGRKALLRELSLIFSEFR
ncbi:sigma-70 family RNA polymerase sigma factor [Streptococcus cristatus]|uniref:sigma-70 family RNA polymerase sigma factor n=1 Tax=Streptococcus cristatus TaxID=45634 RepID=UPI001C839823|nr:sigma-70 family RNA polymerase sigma factor [Streptococcus cristatus]MBX5325944.1 sigma-70 family RNA polymerase sigma factor [Streptococcus cristatus]